MASAVIEGTVQNTNNPHIVCDKSMVQVRPKHLCAGYLCIVPVTILCLIILSVQDSNSCFQQMITVNQP